MQEIQVQGVQEIQEAEDKMELSRGGGGTGGKTVIGGSVGSGC